MSRRIAENPGEPFSCERMEGVIGWAAAGSLPGKDARVCRYYRGTRPWSTENTFVLLEVDYNELFKSK